jgi:hypothetical protein
VIAILARVLYSEALYPSLRTGVYDAIIILYAAYMVLGIWGAAATRTKQWPTLNLFSKRVSDFNTSRAYRH